MELAGRVAVVRGAASGTGPALAERFVTRGPSAVMADGERTALSRAPDRLAADGAPDVAVTCDVGDPARIAQPCQTTPDSFRALHVPGNNAAVRAKHPGLQTRPAGRKASPPVQP